MGAPPSPIDVGRTGEAAALAYYLRSGYRLVARNWRCSLGELDLVVAKGSMLVFCEVKCRRGARLGGPYEAVTWKKQRKIRMLAEAFLAVPDRQASAVRFDVASVVLDAAGTASIFVFEGAF